MEGKIGGIKGNKVAFYLKILAALSAKHGGRQSVYDSISLREDNVAMLWCTDCNDVAMQRRVRASLYLCVKLHANQAPENVINQSGRNQHGPNEPTRKRKERSARK